MPIETESKVVIPPPPYMADLINGPSHGEFVLCSEAIQNTPQEVDFSFGLTGLGSGPFPELSFDQRAGGFRRSVVVSSVGRFDAVCDPYLFHFMARFAYHGRAEAMRGDYNWFVAGCYNPNKRVGNCRIFPLDVFWKNPGPILAAMLSMAKAGSLNGSLVLEKASVEEGG